jgi:large subunit ribosomal protein L13
VKTYSAKAGEIDRRWYVVDAAQAPLGRLATQIATLLRGKHKPIYTPHVDTGDHVIVVNADQLQLSGRKMEQKIYDRFTGFSSGRRVRTARTQLGIDSTEMVRQAVKGMLPKGPLGRQMLSKLKVYQGGEHPHAAQKPQPLEISAGSGKTPVDSTNR